MTRLRRLLARRWAVMAQWPHDPAPSPLHGRNWSQAGAERRARALQASGKYRTAHLEAKELP